MVNQERPNTQLREGGNAHKLLLVAFSICSSRAVLAEVDHQLIMAMADCSGTQLGEQMVVYGEVGVWL